MRSRPVLLFAILCGTFWTSIPRDAAAAGGNVLTYHDDCANTGQYLTEPLLSATNVNVNNFGKLFTYNVDGQVYAQPLYKSGVTVTTGSYQGTRNLVFVATEHDSLYAFDADISAGSGPVWQDSFLNPAVSGTTLSTLDVSSQDISPEIGITGTPVIDPSTSTIFVCAKSKEYVSGSTHFVCRLHAIDLGSGAEKAGSPVVIGDVIGIGTNPASASTFVTAPSVPGNGDGNVSGQVLFNPIRENQRPALSLVNGVVYVGFAAHGDYAPFHGWVIGYSSTNYQLVAVWNADPNGSDSGIWQAGARLSSDSAGNLYFMTGNGTFTQPTYNAASGAYVNGQYGDSFVKLAVDTVYTSSTNQNTNGWGLYVRDYFTAFNQATLSGQDKDVGSGGCTLLPDGVGSVSHPHLLVGASKEGRIYLVDRDNLGGYNATADPVVQENLGTITSCYSSPAYFNGVFYYAAAHDYGRSFAIVSGSFTNTGITTPDKYGFPGATPCISGSGATDPNAILWCLDGGGGSQELRAYLASNPGVEIYDSSWASNDRDLTWGCCKFALPTIANTRVYVPTTYGLLVYGLFNAPPTIPPAAPSNLAAVASGTGSISLSWTNNSTTQSGSYIEQSSDGATFSQIAATGSSAVSYSATGLSAGAAYYFRVRAFNAVGDSAYSGTAVAATFCAAPTGPLAIGGNGMVSMAWNPSSGATGYNIYRALASGGEGSTAYLSGIAGTSATDSAVTNGLSYYYTVGALNASGTSGQSIEFSATPTTSLTIGQWKLEQFGGVLATQSPAAADTAAPAGDGVDNLTKYALGLDANVTSAASVPIGATENIGGTVYLTLTFQRPHPAPSDLTYIVETSGTLAAPAWTPAVVVSGYPVDNGDGTETMKERSSQPVSAGSQFIRLRVTGP
jgi:hypothetical protein